MKYLAYLLTFIIISGVMNAQPVSQLEQIEGLMPYIQGYGTSEAFTGSDTAWINESQRFQRFDENDKLIEFKQKNWENDNWNNNNRTTYVYNEDSLLSETMRFEWDHEGWWIETGKSEFSYDDEQRVISTVSHYKDEGEWHLSNEETNVFDDNGYLIEQVTMTHVGMRPDTTRTLFIFDEEYNLLERLVQKFNNGEWTNHEAYRYEYYNGYMIKSEDLFWYAGEEYKDKKDSLLYDENGNLVEIVRAKYYDGYEFDSRYTMAYDEEGRQIEMISENWLGNKWGFYTKYTTEYDEEGKPTNKFRQKYRQEAWEDELETTLTYDVEGRLIDYTNFLWFIEDWRRNGKTTYDYTPVSVKSTVLPNNSSFNFPNPLISQTTLQVELENAANTEIQIMNYRGQIVRTMSLGQLNSGVNQVKLNLSDLSSGNYFYLISGNNVNIQGNLSIVR